MGQLRLEESAVIAAAPPQVYAVIRDYQVAHAAILPKPYFQEMVVTAGGQGAGTKIRLKMKVMGREFNYDQVVSEPEPGRVIREADEKAGVVTTFTFDPLNGGAQTRLTIATDSRTQDGIAGFIERLMTPLIMRRIYRQELQNIANYVRQKD